MRILIATGIYPPDIGGPAQYAKGVEEAWRKEGHKVKVLAFRFERELPTGIRHLYYFLRVLFSLGGVDFVFSPDTFSAALPALCAAKLCGKKVIIRTGGDFLWEQYVERTGDLVLLRNFYTEMNTPPSSSLTGTVHLSHPKTDAQGLAKLQVFASHPLKRGGGRGGVKLNPKERLVFLLVRFLFRYADAIIFSTKWQRDIFAQPYQVDPQKCFIVENFYGPRIRSDLLPDSRSDLKEPKVFVGGTRDLKWKNMTRLKEAFERVQKRGLPVELKWETRSRGKFLLDIQSAYAVIIASLGDVSPNTILEAISFGKPFILTRECGLYEKLKDIGVWANPEDVSDIAEKIEWLADERNYAEQCKKVAAFTFTHSWEQIADEILTLYRNL